MKLLGIEIAQINCLAKIRVGGTDWRIIKQLSQ